MAEKIKIILAVSNDLEGDQRLHKMALSLKKKGWEPSLIGRMTGSSGKIDRPYETSRMRMLFRRGPAFYFFLNLRLFLKLLFIRGDIFVANDLDTLAGVYLASKLRSKPLVYDSHEYFTEVPELVNRPRIQRIWKLIERKIQPKLKMVITVNESIAELFREEYNNKVEVIRNLPLRQSGLKNPDQIETAGKPLIIYQGAVNVGRGIEEMIAAMQFLEGFEFLIVGGGDLFKAISRTVKEKGLTDRIFLTGRVPFEELGSYTTKAQFGISLEQDIGLNYRLSLPNKLFDYMRSGIPVIASNLPEISRVVKDVDYGVVVDDYSPRNLARVISDLWNDRERYSAYSNNARKRADEYCWEQQEKVLFDIYERALQSMI